MTIPRTSALRRGMACAGILGLGLSLVAPVEAQEFRWRQNVLWGPTDVNTKYQKLFADRVTERTNGAITITQFPGSTLMKAREAAKETSRGTLKIDGNASMFYEGFVPFLNLFSLPFTGLNASDMRLLIQPGTEGRKIVDEALAHHNVKLLAFWDGGTAGLVAKEPLPTLESLKGKKLRIAPKVAGGVLRLVGAQVISMPGSEAVDAMRRGIVEASSIEPKGIISRGYYDVAKYWNDWSILPIGATIMMNLDEWNRLPESMQEIVWNTAQEIEAEVNRAAQEAQDAALEDVVANRGMTVVRIDAAERAKLRAAGVDFIKETVAAIEPRPRPRRCFGSLKRPRPRKATSSLIVTQDKFSSSSLSGMGGVLSATWAGLGMMTDRSRRRLKRYSNSDKYR